MLMKYLRQVLSKVTKLKRFFATSPADWRQPLAIRDRTVLSSASFDVEDRLYRGFCLADLDDAGNIDVASFEPMDLSCNWSRFAIPSDIRHRQGGCASDGCYSITVRTARYRSLATPCHDPIQTADYENYAHVEIRWLQPGENVLDAPPHGRRSRGGKMAKADRLAWRTNAVRNLTIELNATA
jgi:hypothetical protein